MKIKWEDGSVTNETWETVDPIDSKGLVYVMWDEGSLKDRDSFGGYYQSDLKKYSEEAPKPQHPCPCWEDKSVYCPECKTHKTSDLKSNYMAMLQDLKDEHKEAYEKADYAWVARLEQKIKDLEAKIQEMFGNEKQSDIIDHPSGTNRLTVIDQTPPGDKANYNQDGGTSASEYQDELAMPQGQNRSLNSAEKLTYPLVMSMTKEQLIDLPTIHQGHYSNLKFDDGQHRVWVSRMTMADGAQEDNAVEFEVLRNGRWTQASLKTEAKNKCAVCQQEFNTWPEYDEHKKEKHSPKTSALKINVFNRDWNVTPIAKGSSIGYDIYDGDKKVMHIKPANGKEWSTTELQAALKNELQRGFKQAKLVDKIAFLPQGTKVLVLAISRDKKQVKIANLEHSVRAWVPSTKIKLLALESQTVQHKGHSDPVLGSSSTETLLDCVDEGPIWVSSTELLDSNRPPATPESLHEEPHIEEEAAKDCPDCHGNFVGAEGEKCPTCGRYAVDKAALKTALPPTIPNQRGYLDNPPVDKTARGCDQCNAAMINGVFCHETGCPNARKEREQEDMEMEGSLDKQATVVHRSDGWHVLSEKGKNLGGPYKSKAEAVKRLRQVEYFKHHGSLRPFSKKTAEVLTDPYQELHTQVQTLRDRMSLVQERLATNPLPKEAGEGEKDNSELDIPALLEDLSMGIDLLETKLQGDKVEQDVHPAIEEMENLLWSVEEKLGITPKLSEEEKAKPEHKEIVKDLEKESAVSCPACGARLHDRKAGAKCEECGTPVPEELIVKEATTTPTSPVSPSSPVSPGTSTPATPTDADKPTCALCGGLEFTDFAQYQNHMEYTHASDTMPTSPSQKNLPTTVGSKKKAADVTLTDESIEDKLTNQPVTDSTTQLMPVPPVTSPQNVQPTDDDNLEVPTQMPISVPPPGTKWTWDAVNGKFVIMTDPSLAPGKII